MKFIVASLALPLLAGCAGIPTVTVDLDRPAQTAASSAAPERNRPDRAAALEDALAAPEMPDDLRGSLRDLAAAADALDAQAQRAAQKHRQDFLQLCHTILQGPAPAVTPAEQEWLESQRRVPVAASAVDCVFYRHHYASAVFLKPGAGDDFYFKYEILPLVGPARRVAKNPVAYAQDKHVRQTVSLAGTYHELVQSRPEFTYCIETRDGCMPRTVKRRATIVFTRDRRPVETLHLLDELVTRNAYDAGLVLRRVAIYSETAQEYLTTIMAGEDPDKLREAMEYAMPKEIIYVRAGRETLRLDEAALAAVRRAMVALPARF